MYGDDVIMTDSLKERKKAIKEGLTPPEEMPSPDDDETVRPPGCCANMCCNGDNRMKGRGGVLGGWLVYDFIVFLICAGLASWAIFARAKTNGLDNGMTTVVIKLKLRI